MSNETKQKNIDGITECIAETETIPDQWRVGSIMSVELTIEATKALDEKIKKNPRIYEKQTTSLVQANADAMELIRVLEIERRAHAMSVHDLIIQSECLTEDEECIDYWMDKNRDQAYAELNALSNQ